MLEDDKGQYLDGGREGKIYKQGAYVYRPANPWTKNIHEFLNYLRKSGMINIPVPYGINEEYKEILSFVPGTAYNYPLPMELRTDEVLKEAARLLKNYHRLGKCYLKKLTGKEVWMLPPIAPMEVMCHGDFAPYNVTIVDGKPAGIIDFDTLHPGPVLWDVAYAVYRWVPFTSTSNPDYYDEIEEQVRKAKVFLDAYEATLQERKALPDMMVKRLESLVSYMTGQAKEGNEDFEKNLKEGHGELYMQDIAYINKYKETLLHGIL
ncbi:MAG: aminoglycoside phosphotransferase family protein [Clostridium sp.]|nr:aminoglycoside phosphotransferase family protein [Clostridium sp.]